MRFRNERVRLDTIDYHDDLYLITTEKDTHLLAQSIKSIGLLRPPLLIKNKSAYRIVSGFRRIAAAVSLGFSDMDAWLLNDFKEPLDIIKIAIVENTLQRPLNIVEKARSLKMLSTCIIDRDELSRTANAVGLSSDPKLITKLLTIASATESVQEGLIHGYISMPVALMIEAYDDRVSNLFAEIFKRLRPSLNRQRELISLITEISCRDGVDPYHLMKDKLFTEIMDDADLDRNQRIQHVLKRLKKIRYPEISKAEDTFSHHVKNLMIGKGMKLVPPHQFESRNYMFQLTFKNLQEIESIALQLNRVIKHHEFKKILER